MPSQPEWMIEPIDDRALTYELNFSDRIAHERQDLIGRCLSFVTGLDDVLEAYQEDRERINLRLADHGAERVTNAVADWWAQASEQPAPWAPALKLAAASVHATLKPMGFRKNGSLFNRATSPGVIQVVQLRRVDDAGTDRVRVEVGIFLEKANDVMAPGSTRPAWISEAHCQIRQPLATRRGDEVPGFVLSDGADPVVAFVDSAVIAVLERLRTEDEILQESNDGRVRLGWLRSEPRAIASILADHGKTDSAHRVLQDVYEQATPVARSSLLALAERLGVSAIETGSEPTLSRSDEAFLASWTASQGDRIAELERLLADHPPLRRGIGGVRQGRRGVRLDRSDASVHALWRWLLVTVADADDLLPEPRTLPRRFRHPVIEDLSPSEQHLAGLVAAYLAAVVREHRPDVAWGLSPTAELGLVGPHFVPLVGSTHDAVRWAKRPPPTIRDPAGRRFDQLSRCVEQAIVAR